MASIGPGAATVDSDGPGVINDHERKEDHCAPLARNHPLLQDPVLGTLPVPDKLCHMRADIRTHATSLQ